jgi:uncharacterized protein
VIERTYEQGLIYAQLKRFPVVAQLQPRYKNMRKRQVKSPKVYINDTGILHTLLNIHTQEALESHPKVGASWEGFIRDEICRYVNQSELYFWATHAGADLDLLLVTPAGRFGVEIKRTVSPKTTRSIHSAIDDLNLTKVFVVHAGDATFPLTEKVTAVASQSIRQEIVDQVEKS